MDRGDEEESCMREMNLGLDEALRLTLEHITPLPHEDVFLVDSIGRIAASDLFALADSPSVDTSRKDGYAVISGDVAGATCENPVRLRVLGVMAAGSEQDIPPAGHGRKDTDRGLYRRRRGCRCIR